MDPLSAIGAVASIWQIAQAALTLSKTLYTLGSAVGSASEDLQVLADDLRTFSQSLTLLSRLLEDSKSWYSDDIYLLTAKIIKDCADLYVKIDKILIKLGSNGKSTWKVRMKFVYKESTIQKLLSRLRDMKGTLATILMSLQVDLQLSLLNISSTSKIQRPSENPLRPETLQVLQDAHQSILSGGILTKYSIQSEEVVQMSAKGVHISTTCQKTVQRSFNSTSYSLTDTTGQSKSHNISDRAAVNAFSAVGSFMTVPSSREDMYLTNTKIYSDDSTVSKTDLKRWPSSEKVTSRSAPKAGSRQSFGGAPTTSSLKSSSSVESFKSAVSIQECDLDIARQVKCIQRVMHAFRTALQTLESLMNQRLIDANEKLCLSANALKKALHSGKTLIEQTHLGYYKLHGNDYIEFFTASRLGDQMRKVGLILMSDIVMKLHEYSGEYEDLTTSLFDDLTSVTENLTTRVVQCLDHIASKFTHQPRFEPVPHALPAFGGQRIEAPEMSLPFIGYTFKRFDDFHRGSKRVEEQSLDEEKDDPSYYGVPVSKHHSGAGKKQPPRPRCFTKPETRASPKYITGEYPEAVTACPMTNSDSVMVDNQYTPVFERTETTRPMSARSPQDTNLTRDTRLINLTSRRGRSPGVRDSSAYMPAPRKPDATSGHWIASSEETSGLTPAYREREEKASQQYLSDGRKPLKERYSVSYDIIDDRKSQSDEQTTLVARRKPFKLGKNQSTSDTRASKARREDRPNDPLPMDNSNAPPAQTGSVLQEYQKQLLATAAVTPTEIQHNSSVWSPPRPIDLSPEQIAQQKQADLQFRMKLMPGHEPYSPETNQACSKALQEYQTSLITLDCGRHNTTKRQMHRVDVSSLPVPMSSSFGMPGHDQHIDFSHGLKFASHSGHDVLQDFDFDSFLQQDENEPAFDFGESLPLEEEHTQKPSTAPASSHNQGPIIHHDPSQSPTVPEHDVAPPREEPVLYVNNKQYLRILKRRTERKALLDVFAKRPKLDRPPPHEDDRDVDMSSWGSSDEDQSDDGKSSIESQALQVTTPALGEDDSTRPGHGYEREGSRTSPRFAHDTYPVLEDIGHIMASNIDIIDELAWSYPALSPVQASKFWWQSYIALNSGVAKSPVFTSIEGGLRSELGISSSKSIPDDVIAKRVSEGIRRLNLASIVDKSELTNVLNTRSDVLKILDTVDGQLGFEVATLGWTCVYVVLSLYDKLMGIVPVPETAIIFLQASLSHLQYVVSVIARYAVMENLYKQSGGGLSLKPEYSTALRSLCSKILEYFAIAIDVAKKEIASFSLDPAFLGANERDEDLQKCAFCLEAIKQKDAACQSFKVVVDTIDDSSDESDSEGSKVEDVSDEDWERIDCADDVDDEKSI